MIARSVEDGAPRLKLSVPERLMVVVGRHGRPEVDVELERCLAEEVPVVRRPSGGGTVVLGPGQVVVSISLPVPTRGRLEHHLANIGRWLSTPLSSVAGVAVGVSGFSDLTVEDRKISGSGMLWRRGVLYYSAVILVNADLSVIDRLLRHPAKEPDYRAGRSHLAFVQNLAAWNPALTASAVVSQLQRELSLSQLL